MKYSKEEKESINNQSSYVGKCCKSECHSGFGVQFGVLVGVQVGVQVINPASLVVT